MIVKRITSGGQLGADLGALKCALNSGIPTGGWMPKGALTEDGPRSDILQEYGLRETLTTRYPHRTRLCIRDADATLIFHRINYGAIELGPGSRLTLNMCWRFGKPVFLMPVCEGHYEDLAAQFLVTVLTRVDSSATLNVAGPRESHAYGMERMVHDSLERILERTEHYEEAPA